MKVGIWLQQSSNETTGIWRTTSLSSGSICPRCGNTTGLRFMGVFGSYVRGEQRRGSDLDLLVEFDERPLTLLQFIALEHYLSDLLEVRVDLVERNTLKPTIGRHILAEVVPL